MVIRLKVYSSCHRRTFANFCFCQWVFLQKKRKRLAVCVPQRRPVFRRQHLWNTWGWSRGWPWLDHREMTASCWKPAIAFTYWCSVRDGIKRSRNVFGMGGTHERVLLFAISLIALKLSLLHQLLLPSWPISGCRREERSLYQRASRLCSNQTNPFSLRAEHLPSSIMRTLRENTVTVN